MFLIGSRNRTFVISDLDRYIEDPDSVVTPWIIRLRTLFDFVAHHPKPLYTSVWAIQRDGWEMIRSEAQKRQKEFEDMLRERAEALVTLPDRKSAAVREKCVDAIAELAPEAAIAAKLVPPKDFGMTRQELIAHRRRLSMPFRRFCSRPRVRGA